MNFLTRPVQLFTFRHKNDMAISNELSSDIVIALLEKTDGSPEKMDALKEILLEVHSTLQSLSDTARREQTQTPGVRKAAANQT